MTRPQFEAKFNFGHLLTVGAMLVALGGGWAIFEQKTSANERSIQQLEPRVRILEQGQARADVNLENIYNLLSRIDNRLERMEEQ